MEEIDLLEHWRSKEKVLSKIPNHQDIFGNSRDGCHCCNVTNFMELYVHHIHYWENCVKFSKFNNSMEYHEALLSDMEGHEEYLIKLCRKHHQLIEKLMKWKPWDALIFLETLRAMKENIADKKFFEEQCSILCQTSPEAGVLEPISQIDFDNWYRIEQVYVRTFTEQKGMVFCPQCREFMYDPCLHLEKWWHSHAEIP